MLKRQLRLLRRRSSAQLALALQAMQRQGAPAYALQTHLIIASASRSQAAAHPLGICLLGFMGIDSAFATPLFSAPGAEDQRQCTRGPSALDRIVVDSLSGRPNALQTASFSLCNRCGGSLDGTDQSPTRSLWLLSVPLTRFTRKTRHGTRVSGCEFSSDALLVLLCSPIFLRELREVANPSR